MSVDYCPTCPDCGDDLVYDPQPFKESISLPRGWQGDWQCPDCFKWFDLPEGPLPEPEPE